MAKAKGFVESGLATPKDKGGTFIPVADRLPVRKEYLHMSKADVQAAEKKRKSDEGRVAKFADKIANEDAENIETEAIDPDKALDAVEAKATEAPIAKATEAPIAESTVAKKAKSKK